ncbi:MAG: flagellar hook-basal body complex protein FliE [Candidatus Acidiferrales bacterium]|jgi:flagellar hook-basal body complex protein FliE
MANPIAGIASATPSTQPSSAAAASGGEQNEFFQTLDGVMNQVNDASGDAQTKVREMLQGNGQDLHTAMIAVEKADLSFQLMMQVRNKIIQAYQTISQMQF